ncbi:RDD family protein, partial [Vibrio parahaemolyticus]
TALLFGLAVTVANYFYHAVCESSQMQGTFGKQILGLRVTSRNFRQLTFREASIRYWSKIFAFFIGLFANSFIQALSIPVLSSDQLGLIAI